MMLPEELRTATDETIREALACADPVVLLGLIYHATANEALSDVRVSAVPVGFSSVNVVEDQEQAAWVRNSAFDLLTAYRDGRLEPPGPESAERLQKAMSLAAADAVPLEEVGLNLDVLDLDPEPKGWGKHPAKGNVDKFNVVIVGAGLAGINAAVQLKVSGIPFKLLEKNSGVGGTWFNNRYPGARVDWPSRLYSHSFGLTYPFRHLFAPREENEHYLRWCVERFGLDSHIELNTEVTEFEWDDEAGVWIIRSRGPDHRESTRTARAVISAIGLLERPSIPEIPGLKDFAGPSFHSSRFDPTVGLGGKRVAVVGTGASGMQMVPDLAPLVGRVVVFQRSPAWVLPIPGYRDPLPDGALWLEKNVPYYASWFRFVMGWTLGDHKLYRIFEVDPDWSHPSSVNEVNHTARERVLAYLKEKLSDRPDLQSKCIPDYPIFANRPVVDNGWFDAIKRANVELVTDRIARITEDAIICNDGIVHPVDIIVFATGFRPNEYFSPIKVTGRGGIPINDVWAKDGPRAYWGVAIPNFPNLFILYGPNANPRNLGPVQYGEWAMQYFLECFKALIESDLKSIEVKQEAFDRFNAAMDVRLEQLVSVNARTRQKSYYTNEHGRSAVQSPWSSLEVYKAFAAVRFDDYTSWTWDGVAREAHSSVQLNS